MRTFDVYRHPSCGVQAVPEGFSLGAGVFQFWWFIVCGMYANALIVAAIQGIAIALIDADQIEGRVGVFILSFVVIGMAGNDMRRSFLSKRGFKHLGKFEALAEGNAVEDALQVAGSGEIREEGRQREGQEFPKIKSLSD